MLTTFGVKTLPATKRAAAKSARAPAGRKTMVMEGDVISMASVIDGTMRDYRVDATSPTETVLRSLDDGTSSFVSTYGLVGMLMSGAAVVIDRASTASSDEDAEQSTIDDAKSRAPARRKDILTTLTMLAGAAVVTEWVTDRGDGRGGWLLRAIEWLTSERARIEARQDAVMRRMEAIEEADDYADPEAISREYAALEAEYNALEERINALDAAEEEAMRSGDE